MLSALAYPASRRTRIGGYTLGPPIAGFSRPLAASAVSRMISASTRKRDWRASRLLPGSRSSRSGRDPRRLPVNRRSDDQPVNCLLAPTAIHEADGQPVEQFGMARLGAHCAEIVLSLHQPFTEIGLPQAVNGYAGGQRIVAIHQPAGEVQPVASLEFRRDRGWRSRVDRRHPCA